MFLYIQFGTSVAMERNYNALVYISVYTSFLTAADGGEKSTGLAKILPAMLRYSYQPGSARQDGYAPFAWQMYFILRAQLNRLRF